MLFDGVADNSGKVSLKDEIDCYGYLPHLIAFSLSRPHKRGRPQCTQAQLGLVIDLADTTPGPFESILAPENVHPR